MPLSIELPPELVERIARRAADLVAERSHASPWLNTQSAAEYLDCPPSRIHDLRALRKLTPRKDGSRLLFRREDLDAYVER
jgi:excisionase family DNA binding protein